MVMYAFQKTGEGVYQYVAQIEANSMKLAKKKLSAANYKGRFIIILPKDIVDIQAQSPQL